RALGGDEVADVVEGDHARPIPTRISGDPYIEDALAALPQNGRLTLMEAQPQRARLVPDDGDAVLSRGQRHADEAAFPAQKPIGGGVRDCDRAIVVDAENAGGHA